MQMKKGSFALSTFLGGGCHSTPPSPPPPPQKKKKKTAARETSYFMARLQASLLYGRPAALVHGKILCSMTAVYPGADLGGGCRGCASPPPEMPCDFLIQLVFCIKICLRHQSLTPFPVQPVLRKILDPP